MSGAPEIVCLATRRLHDPMPTIVQHLMAALGRRTRVLYVEPPADPVFLARRGRRRGAGDAGGLTRVVPLVLPFERRLPAFGALNRRLVAARIRRAVARWRRGSPVLWVASPTFARLADALADLPLCYYASDNYRAAPAILEVAGAETVAALEARLLARARWVLVNSSALLHLGADRAGRTFWVPSGVDVERLAVPAAAPADLAALPRPLAGFVGALDDYKVDFELLATVAAALPHVTFVTVGPIGWRAGTGRRPPRAPNVHHLGWRSYDALPAYLGALDVALLPSRTDGYMSDNFPMKLFEYFAAGVPVVATEVRSLRPFSPWLRAARSSAEFAGQLTAALAGRDERQLAEARDVARRNSWERQAGRVLDILHGAVPEPVLPPAAAGLGAAR